MKTQNLGTELHFSELMSSAYFAFKFALLLIAFASTATLGGDALAVACIALAGVCRLLERPLAINDPGFAALLGSGALIFLANHFAGESGKADSSVLLTIPCVVVFSFYLIYSFTRQPFSTLYAKVQAIPLFRLQLCRFWLAIYGVAILICLLLPLQTARGLLCGLAILGAAGHIYLQLFANGRIWQSPTERAVESFQFKRIDNNYDALKPLYMLYLTELMPSLLEGTHFSNSPIEDLVRDKMQAEQKNWDHIAFFAAYHNQELIGTVSCQFDIPTQNLPFESGHSQPLSLNEFRKFGNVVEFGKFCVAGNYRMSPEVFAGLMLCATELALSKGTAFIVLQTVMKSARIYSKMGFAALTKEPVTNLEHGVKVQLLAKALLSEEDAANRLIGNIQDYFSPYVLSRFIWRQVVKTAIQKAINKKSLVKVNTQDLPGLAVFN